MPKFEVTLEQLRQHNACIDGYDKVVMMPREREPGNEICDPKERAGYLSCGFKGTIPLESILDSNGVEDAIWALRCVPGIERDSRMFAVWCARQVQHLMLGHRGISALDVAERFANGAASRDELRDAAAAACDACDAAAYNAADAAADVVADVAAAAADDVADVAAAAAAYAAAAAADAAAYNDAAYNDADAADAADAACDAACDAADAACRRMRGFQSDMFRQMCNGTAPWQKEREMA